MSAVRDVISDLVERRLWPIAVLLVAAAVAIPALLLKPASSGSPPTPLAGAQPPTRGTPAVDVRGPEGGPVVGGRRDPFRQQHVPKSTSSAAGAASSLGPSTGSAGSTSGGGSTSAPTSGSGGSGTGGGSTSPKSSTPTTTLKVRFGQANGSRATRDITAGSPLPSVTNPLLVYLGQTKRGAAFLVSSDAQPHGDGTCEPDKTICSTLYMKTGDTESFDVTGPAGIVEYKLDVLKVTRG